MRSRMTEFRRQSFLGMACSLHSRRRTASAHKPLGAQSQAFCVMRDRHFFRAASFAARRFPQGFLQRFARPPPRRSTRSSNTSRRAAQAHRRRQKPLTARRCVPWCQSLDDAAHAHGVRLVQGRHGPRATRGARPHAAAAQRRYSQRNEGATRNKHGPSRGRRAALRVGSSPGVQKTRQGRDLADKKRDARAKRKKRFYWDSNPGRRNQNPDASRRGRKCEPTRFNMPSTAVMTDYTIEP